MARQKIDLRDGVRALSARRRPAHDEHPAPGRLADYHAGRLPASEAEALRDHLVRCPECVELILDFARLPSFEPVPPGAQGEAVEAPDAEMAAQWRAIERRRAGVPVFELEPVGSRSRGAASSAGRILPAAAHPWESGAVLLLAGVGDLTYPDYAVSLHAGETREGEEVFHLRGLRPDARKGIFTVDVPPRRLGSGRYLIELQGLGRGGPRSLAEYRLLVDES